MPLFLNNIDLNSNELQNAVIQNLATDPVSGAEEGKVYFNTTAKELRVYNGTAWEAVGLNGVTADAAEINILDGATLSTTELNYVDGVTSAIQTQLDSKASASASPTITLGGDLTGSITLTNLSGGTLTATIASNSVALGTDTTGDYVQSLVAGTGVSSTGATSGEGTTHTLSIGQAVGTTDNVTFAGVTADAIRVGVTAAGEIDTTTGNLTIDSAGGTVTVDDNLTVTGNLTVSGTTTTISTETVTVDDNIIVLNNNVTGAPTENAGIEIERGSSTNVQLRWNETTDKWEFTEDGTTYQTLGSSTTLGTVTTGVWNATPIAVAYGGTGSTTASAARLALGATVASASATLPQKLAFDIGNNSATSFVLTHGLNTRDVTVQIAEKSAPYNVVIADIALATADTVSVSFATAPTTNQYRAVIIG
ncbi:hypothetical protein EB001_05615 [bacterium]|nr:hypothetical protein [bacterium]